jgi:hypothetical protein
MNRGTRMSAWLLAAVALLALAWVSVAPLEVASRDKAFEIPRGTYARRMAGNPVDILPSQIRLTLGLQDVLLLRNLDDVPQVFGPTIMMPGQSFRLPFEKAAEYQFDCTAHTSGQMTVIVEPEPKWPWQKIRWRVRQLWEQSGQ